MLSDEIPVLSPPVVLSRSPFGFVSLAVDEPKGDPAHGEQVLISPRSSYT
jgi:hypothetical protein